MSVLKDTQLEKVEELRMIRVKCSSDLLCFLLDLLAKVGYCLKTVSLTHLPLPETERVSLKLQ